MVDQATMQVTAMAVLGVIVQWLKGVKDIPLWVAYVATGVVATALYIWMTPNFSLTATTWRGSVAGWLVFLMAVRGSGSTARDVKVAPATNSI